MRRELGDVRRNLGGVRRELGGVRRELGGLRCAPMLGDCRDRIMTDDRPPRLRAQELLADRYRILSRVECADFGAAWRARDEGSAQVVEVHELRTLRAAVAPVEAAALLRRYGEVKHRALAVVHDAFVHDGAVVAVLASTEGVPVTAWLNEPPRVGIAARLDAVRAVVDQAAQGLWALHRAPGDRSLAHGCFGAACVRVEMRGTQPVVRVEAQGWGQVVVPPAWWICPPEGPAQTPAADVFALGILAATLLGGESTAHSPAAVRARFEALCPEVDASVVDVIAACLSEDPSDRPSDARGLRERFTHPRVSWKPRERPVVAVLPPPPRRTEDIVAPAPTPPIGPQTCLVPVSAAPKAALVEAPRPPPPPAEEEEATAVEQPLFVEEESTDVTRAPGDEATEVVGAARNPKPDLRHTQRIEPILTTRVIPVPDDEATEVGRNEPEERTDPIGDHVAGFAPAGGARDQTLVPGGRVPPVVAFVPEEQTAPMGPMLMPAMEGLAPRGGRPPQISAPASEATRAHAVPVPSALPIAALVAAVVGAGVLLGLVLWWAIR